MNLRYRIVHSPSLPRVIPDRRQAVGSSSGRRAPHRTRTSISTHQHTTQHRRTTMYDMYPEWGPAQHRESAQQAVQAALDLRDNGGERPDDN